MFIVEALLRARTRYAVFFLITAWLETRGRRDAARALPNETTALPLRGENDIRRRIAWVRDKLEERDAAGADLAALMEAAAALSVACERLRELTSEATTDSCAETETCALVK